MTRSQRIFVFVVAASLLTPGAPRLAKVQAAGAKPAEATRPAAHPAARAGAADGPVTASFEPLQFDPRDLGMEQKAFLIGFGGILPAGKGTDYVWGGGRAYLMKSKGRLQTVWKTDERDVRLTGPCYDGRFVWVPVIQMGKPSRLLVIDPSNGRVAEVTAADGLPQRQAALRNRDGGEDSLHVAPVGPGKVCVAGFTGWSWLAIATYQPTAKTVKVFHEARRVPSAGDKQAWKDLSVIYRVSSIVTVTRDVNADADPAVERRVLLAREPGLDHPLIIDPQKLTVAVSQEEGPNCIFEPEGVHGGAIYWALPSRERTRTQPRPNVWKMGFPDFRRTMVAQHVHEGEEMMGGPGSLFFHGGRVFIASKDWWVADGVDKPFRKVEGITLNRFDSLAGAERRVQPHQLPDEQTERITAVMRSEHYGLVVTTARFRSPTLLYEVRLKG